MFLTNFVELALTDGSGKLCLHRLSPPMAFQQLEPSISPQLVFELVPRSIRHGPFAPEHDDIFGGASHCSRVYVVYASLLIYVQVLPIVARLSTDT